MENISYSTYSFKTQVEDIEYILNKYCKTKLAGSNESIIDFLIKRNDNKTKASKKKKSQVSLDTEIYTAYFNDILLPDYDIQNIANTIFPEGKDDEKVFIERVILILNMVIITDFYVQYLAPIFSQSNSLNSSFTQEPLKKIDELIFLANAIEADEDLKLRVSSKATNKKATNSLSITLKQHKSQFKRIAKLFYNDWLIENGIKSSNLKSKVHFNDLAIQENNVTYNAYLYLSITEEKIPSFSTDYLEAMRNIIIGNNPTTKQSRTNFFLSYVGKILKDYINEHTGAMVEHKIIDYFEEKNSLYLIYTAFTLKGLLLHKTEFSPHEGFTESKKLFIRDLIK